MIYLIQGIWFQERGAFGVVFDRTGAVPAWQTAVRRFMFAGGFGPSREDPKVLVGDMTDQAGESSLAGIKLAGSEFSFTKQYEGREHLIRYKFQKQPDGTWSGEWSFSGEAWGKGRARCVLAQVADDFLAIGEEELAGTTYERMKRRSLSDRRP